METVFSPEFMRMSERLIVVLGGILSILLGYRLFDKANIAHNAQGNFKTLAMEVGFNRVGPGVFFAVLGAGVLVYSLASPISVGGGSSVAGSKANRNAAWAFSNADVVQLTLEELSELTELIAKLPEKERQQADKILGSAKVPRGLFYGYSGPERKKDWLLELDARGRTG